MDSEVDRQQAERLEPSHLWYTPGDNNGSFINNNGSKVHPQQVHRWYKSGRSGSCTRWVYCHSERHQQDGLMRFTWICFLSLSRPLLDDILSLMCVNHTTHLGVICKLAEGALDPTVYVIDTDIKQYWSQYKPLRDNMCHRSPSGHWAFDHCPLDVIIQSHPPNSPPT